MFVYAKKILYSVHFSLFFLHNETVNIWSHLLGFFYFLWLMVENMVEAQPHIRTIEDRAAVSLQLLTYQVYIHPCTWEDRDAVSLQLHTITRQCSLDLSDKKMIYSYSTVQYSKVH